ncbi:unnamed protein product [Porites evermanni]|uniref:Uncharacterized protein n=1 Tax=Porites evermanni TaxID=104178 RepID=A0ABN8MQ36_9CNID|nr:unnamed protein product [Porites evermanni]
MADDELPNFDIISSFGLQAPENEAKNRSQKNEVADNKRRFANMDEEELNGVTNNSPAKQNKKVTQWAVTVVTDESSSSSLVNVSQLISFRQKSKLLLNKNQELETKLQTNGELN